MAPAAILMISTGSLDWLADDLVGRVDCEI